jgi:hypothetical protein
MNSLRSRATLASLALRARSLERAARGARWRRDPVAHADRCATHRQARSLPKPKAQAPCLPRPQPCGAVRACSRARPRGRSLWGGVGGFAAWGWVAGGEQVFLVVVRFAHRALGLRLAPFGRAPSGFHPSPLRAPLAKVKSICFFCPCASRTCMALCAYRLRRKARFGFRGAFHQRPPCPHLVAYTSGHQPPPTQGAPPVHSSSSVVGVLFVALFWFVWWAPRVVDGGVGCRLRRPFCFGAPVARLVARFRAQFSFFCLWWRLRRHHWHDFCSRQLSCQRARSCALLRWHVICLVVSHVFLLLHCSTINKKGGK